MASIQYLTALHRRRLAWEPDAVAGGAAGEKLLSKTEKTT
jgi:hypothetical protein